MGTGTNVGNLSSANIGGGYANLTGFGNYGAGGSIAPGGAF